MRYAISNRIKPFLNPTNHFLGLKGNLEAFGRLLQCRTGHAYTEEFRQSFIRLSADPTTCPCDGDILETRNHILRDCPRYHRHRKLLAKASRGLSLASLLGTKLGIAALSEFLIKSGAFSRTGTPVASPTIPLFESEPEPDMDQIFPQDDGRPGCQWAPHKYDNLSPYSLADPHYFHFSLFPPLWVPKSWHNYTYGFYIVCFSITTLVVPPS